MTPWHETGNGDRARCGHVRTLGLTARALPVDRTPLLTGCAERKSWTSGILSQGAVSRPSIAQTATHHQTENAAAGANLRRSRTSTLGLGLAEPNCSLSWRQRQVRLALTLSCKRRIDERERHIYIGRSQRSPPSFFPLWLGLRLGLLWTGMYRAPCGLCVDRAATAMAIRKMCVSCPMER